MKKWLSILLCLLLAVSAVAVASAENVVVEEVPNEGQFEGEELSILVSADWMGSRYDETIARFEETYGVTVDLQTLPADQYFNVLTSDLDNGTCPDVFWIQSNPVGAIESMIGDPENRCIDFTGADWQNVMPESRQSACISGGKLYGLQVWHNSPEYVMVYNKTLFDELGLTAPTTYDELKDVCAKIAEAGITPWFMAGADGWRHQLAFFQIGGVYEEATPGLYDALNTNQATFAGNEKMLQVLEQFKELSDLGYFGEDWIGTDSSNQSNEFADRTVAFTIENSSTIKQIVDDTGTTDEFGLFLIPLGDNTWFTTSPAGPTMFGYKGTEHEDLVRAWFQFVCTPQSLQEILDNSPKYTNLHVNVDIEQHWLPEEEAFMATIPPEKLECCVLQNGTKYTNDYWMQFGQDMIEYVQGGIEANEVLERMDGYRAEGAAAVGDEYWQ